MSSHIAEEVVRVCVQLILLKIDTDRINLERLIRDVNRQRGRKHATSYF